MKTRSTRSILLLPFLLLLLATGIATAQNTAFTYSGRLNDNGVPVNGSTVFLFTVFDSAGGDTVIHGPLNSGPVDVVNGLFIVRIDFGANVFTGPPRWLDIQARVPGAATFKLLTPRQEMTSAPYAIRAQTAGALADGSLTASQLRIGGAAPVAGQFLSYSGGDLVWTDPGVAAGGIWALNGLNAYFNGNVGIGTNAPTPGIRLEVNGASLFRPGNGTIQFGSPNSELGFSMLPSVGDSRVDLRFDGSNLRLLASAGRVPPSSANGIVIGTNGNVGIGTGVPGPGIRLDINGATRMSGGGSGGVVQFGAPSTESGMSISGINRSDVRFDGFTLKLLAGTGVGPPSPLNGIAIHTSGNVSIGSLEPPQAKLQVVAQNALSLVGYQPFLTLYDSNAGYAGSRIQGVNGEIVLEPASFINGSNPNSSVVIANSGNVSVRTLTIRGGADLAEPFELSQEGIPKGSVVVIDDQQPGKLKLSTRAYDTRVAGIVSGANGVNPGISLRQVGVLDAGDEVSLSGRVYVLADASGGAIRPGDLLTTSDRPGHAMKVSDFSRCQGAVIGKAMGGLSEGTGMVLVLVTLQ